MILYAHMSPHADPRVVLSMSWQKVMYESFTLSGLMALTWNSVIGFVLELMAYSLLLNANQNALLVQRRVLMANALPLWITAED
jgi:hypothetical protein